MKPISKFFPLTITLLFLTVCAWAEDKKDPPPITSLSSNHKSALQMAVTGTDAQRTKAEADMAKFGPLSKKAASDLRSFVAAGWDIPAPTGWKGTPTAAGGMREIDVPGLGKREYFLYVPPGYTPTKNWPLVVSLHGAGGEGKGTFTWLWQKNCKEWPGFIACPSGNPPQAQWFGASWDKSNVDQRPFVMGVLADMRKNFRVDDDRVVIEGFSNGGNGAWYFGLHDPSLWCGMIPRSGGASENGFFCNLTALPALVIHGVNDTVIKIDMDRKSVDEMKQLKCDVTLKEMQGAHEPFIDKVTSDIIAWMKQRKRAFWPKKIVHRFERKDENHAYWIEAKWNANLEVTAEVKEGNKIEVSANGAEELTFWLSDDLVNLDAPITITLNGKNAFEGMVPRRIDTLAEWLIATGDRAAGPVARVSVKP